MEDLVTYTTTALFGVLAHVLVFKRIEVDTHPLLVLVIFSLSPFAIHYTCTVNLLTALSLTATFTTYLCISIAIYRFSFHPLRQFPGRPLARISQLHSLTLTAQSGLKWHKVVQSLHAEYGDYVRTGPRELSVADPAALSLILGYGVKAGKGPMYNALEESVHTTRDREYHTQRRKKAVVSSYGPQIEGFTSSLLTRVRENLDTPCTINDLAYHYSYDVVTQLAFGRAGGFITGTQSEDAGSVMAAVKESTYAFAFLYHMPWLLTIITTLSFLPGPMKAANDWSQKMLSERKKVRLIILIQKSNTEDYSRINFRGTEGPDLIGHLIANTPNTRKDAKRLFADTRLIIAAGSDTTATALTTLITLLASSPHLTAHLRSEIDPLLLSNPSTFTCSTSYPILDSLINETLRLHPVVLFGSQRTNTSSPMMIPSSRTSHKQGQDAIYIPRDTVLSMPTYTLHRDSRNFAHPNEFILERWTTKPHLILNRQAFIPFSTGMTNCPGKNLAMLELRDVIVRLVFEFDISLPPLGKAGDEFDMSKFMEGTQDCFTATVPDVVVVFKTRKWDE